MVEVLVKPPHGFQWTCRKHADLLRRLPRHREFLAKKIPQRLPSGASAARRGPLHSNRNGGLR